MSRKTKESSGYWETRKAKTTRNLKHSDLVPKVSDAKLALFEKFRVLREGRAT